MAEKRKYEVAAQHAGVEHVSGAIEVTPTLFNALKTGDRKVIGKIVARHQEVSQYDQVAPHEQLIGDAPGSRNVADFIKSMERHRVKVSKIKASQDKFDAVSAAVEKGKKPGASWQDIVAMTGALKSLSKREFKDFLEDSKEDDIFDGSGGALFPITPPVSRDLSSKRRPTEIVPEQLNPPPPFPEHGYDMGNVQAKNVVRDKITVIDVPEYVIQQGKEVINDYIKFRKKALGI